MKHKIMVAYKSSTGFTKKYAEAISNELNGTLVEYKDATAELMSGCHTVVFGSRAHAGRIDGYKKIKDTFQKSSAHKLALFVTGATPATAKSTIEGFWAQNLSPKELESTPHFYMPGGLCYEKMSLPDKLMMKMAATMMKKKKNKTAQDLAFEQAISVSYDISDMSYIKPLVACLKHPEK